MKAWVPQRCCQLFVVLNPIFRSIPPPLVVAGSLRLAEEHHEVFCEAVRATDAGKAAARIAAVEIALDHLLDDRPEKTVLPLETTLILSQKPVEMMEQHPVEDRPLRMSVTIESRHSRRKASRRFLPSEHLLYLLSCYLMHKHRDVCLLWSTNRFLFYGVRPYARGVNKFYFSI